MRTAILTLALLTICSAGSSQDKGTVTDPRDNREYKTVKIDNRWLMAENLAYKPRSGKFWAYKNDPKNVAKYGYLYDWDTAKQVAFAGWHLPTKADWDQLYKYLADTAQRSSVDKADLPKAVYGQLMPGGSSGFMALLAGIFLGPPAKVFHSLGEVGYFWSATPVGGNQAYRFYCKAKPDEPGDYAGAWGFPSQCGLSVRLFQDQ